MFDYRPDCDRAKYDRARSHRNKSTKALSLRRLLGRVSPYIRITADTLAIVNTTIVIWVNLHQHLIHLS